MTTIFRDDSYEAISETADSYKSLNKRFGLIEATFSFTVISSSSMVFEFLS